MPKFLTGSGRYAKVGYGWRIKGALLDAWSVSRDILNGKRHLSMAGALPFNDCSPTPAKHESRAKTWNSGNLEYPAKNSQT